MTSAPANDRRNVTESTLARAPAGGPESGGVASGIATIGAHGPGSGHAHSGSLINAATPGAMSDVACGTPFCVANRPAMVPAMAPVLAATLLFVPCDALSRYFARVTPLPNCLGCVVPCICCGWRHFFGARMEKGLLHRRRPLRQALRAPVLVSTSFLVLFR